jgi:16S rRNA (cytosine1402-N4)-methyltransferase
MTYHKPVLINEVLTYLKPQPNKVYLDVTFGGGGHTQAILDAEPTCKVIAMDWDKKAIELNSPRLVEKYGDRFKIIWGNFSHFYKIMKKERITQIDGLLADFGTSQYQIHEKEGFSFRKNTPLDMRMSAAHQLRTAADIVNEYSEKDLQYIFQEYGQETHARSIARAIGEARKIKKFRTTDDLTLLIEKLVNPKAFQAKRGIHPATQVFQALRIEVNNELGNIRSLLSAAIPLLSPGGRLVCISFHSLEDRLVKTFFKEHESTLSILTPKPVVATPEEITINASSRSAKLRTAEKI